MFEAKVILDSICNGKRLTTMQVTHPRIIHAEFNTHCAFSRNASSSRAIPFAVTVKRVQEDPFIPVFWGENQSGMQAAREIADWKKEKAIKLWLKARDLMVEIAGELASKECQVCKGAKGWDTLTGADAASLTSLWVSCNECQGTGEGINLHKQIANRLTETWAWITVCVTGDADAWSNYFALRCHPDAQPEIQTQAYMAQKLYFESAPQVLKPGQWHTPYIREGEAEDVKKWLTIPLVTGEMAMTKAEASEYSESKAVIQISTGRCARTSYLTQEGVRDFSEDIKLHDRLRYHVPLHASPFEHVCQATGDDKRYAKYTGWKAYRHFLDREYVTDFVPNHPDFTVAV